MKTYYCVQINRIISYLKPHNSVKLICLVWFGLVWFYDISTIVGYLIPNPV